MCGYSYDGNEHCYLSQWKETLCLKVCSDVEFALLGFPVHPLILRSRGCLGFCDPFVLRQRR